MNAIEILKKELLEAKSKKKRWTGKIQPCGFPAIEDWQKLVDDILDLKQAIKLLKEAEEKK